MLLNELSSVCSSFSALAEGRAQRGGVVSSWVSSWVVVAGRAVARLVAVKVDTLVTCRKLLPTNTPTNINLEERRQEVDTLVTCWGSRRLAARCGGGRLSRYMKLGERRVCLRLCHTCAKLLPMNSPTNIAIEEGVGS